MTLATILADSYSPDGYRVTTMQIRLPVCLQKEFNTHRVFSRNSTSSRAIPFAKRLAEVRSTPYVPGHFGAKQPGMQSSDTEVGAADVARDLWRAAQRAASSYADAIGHLDVHKELPNRLIEPFAWQTIIVTSTCWSGFWRQRCDPAASRDFRATALAMREAFDGSTPEPLAEGEWHLPMIRGEDYASDPDRCTMVAAARCARASYGTHDQPFTVAQDLDLFERLVTAYHMSPLEHVCRPVTREDQDAAYPLPSHHNLVGWHTLRQDYDIDHPWSTAERWPRGA